MFDTDIGNEFVKACPAMGFSPDVAAKLALDATRGAGFDAIRTSLPAEALAFAKRVAG